MSTNLGRTTLYGIGVSPGVAFGQVYLVDRRKKAEVKYHIAPELVEHEVARFERAIDEAKEALETLKERAPDHAAILDAHLLMMEDPLLVDGTLRSIKVDLRCAEWALRTTLQSIRTSFDALGDAYFRERRSDVDFVGDRLLSAMSHTDPSRLLGLPIDAVVVAHDLSPADTIALSRQHVRAFVTEVGGSTSHTAILARALNIPAVVGCARILEIAGSADAIVVDGSTGEVLLSPGEADTARLRAVKSARAAVFQEIQKEPAGPAITRDGRRVRLLANIEIPEEIPEALVAGAEGVGLYRSEFLYINRVGLPTDDDHAEVCDQILAALGDAPAALRTFDIGSDKLAAAVKLPREHNPALGLRACRLGLVRPDMLRAQFRGMVRAISARRRGSILLPMIGGVDELLAVKELLNEERARLEDEGVDVWDGLKVGVMIELPAAVWMAAELAAECDYFSVGTNDLIQYTLGIDRGNEQVAHMYQPLHPAVLRAMKHVVDAAHDAKIPVSLCGESGADPSLLPVTLGLGFDALSMPALAISRMRYVLRRLDYGEMRNLVDTVVRERLTSRVIAAVDEALRRAVPDAVEILRAAT